MKPGIKKVLNFLLIFGTLAIVLIVGLNGKDLGQTLEALKSVPLEWLLLCAGAYLLYMVFDALSIWHFLRMQQTPITFFYALFTVIVGQYYSNITPGATGGQPLQIYYMKKKGVPIGLGTSAVLVKLFCFQFMLLVLGSIFWLIYPDYVAENVGSNMWILVVGFAYNAVVVLALLLVALNRKIVMFLVMGVIKLLTRLHLCKDPEGTRNRWEDTVDRFHSSISLLRSHPWDVLIQLLSGGAQLLSMMLVIYFLYKGFGLTGSSWGKITTMGIMIYTSASYTPLPGASGAQEGVFSLYLSQVFPDNVRFVALLLWRFFTYYFSLLLGAVTTVVYGLRKEKKETVATSAEASEQQQPSNTQNMGATKQTEKEKNAAIR